LCEFKPPNACFGSVTPATGLNQTRLTTSTATDQVTMPCGSGETGLKDFLFNFQVAVGGLYSITTANIGSSDTTLTLYTCSGTVLACNDDIVFNVELNSQVVISLSAGVQYLGAVSKYDSSTSEPTFDLVIAALSSSPSFSPSRSPTATVTKTPTTIPSASPTTVRPSTTPSVQASLNQAPSSNPTQFGATLSSNVPTKTTTTITTTTTPTTNGAGRFPNLAQNNSVIVGGSVGGGALLLALGLVFRRRSIRIRQRERWSEAEEARLRQTYERTRDFDVICQQFPDKSRESVASKMKKLAELGTLGAAMLHAPHNESYAILKANSNPSVLREKVSNKLSSSFQRLGTMTTTSTSSLVNNFSPGKRVVLPPPGLGGVSPNLHSLNPLFEIPPPPPPPPAEFGV